MAGIGHPANASEPRSEGSQTSSGQSENGTNLEVLAEDIQDQDSNATRFFAIAPTDARSSGGGKTSLVVYPDVDYPAVFLNESTIVSSSSGESVRRSITSTSISPARFSAASSVGLVIAPHV